MTAPVTRAVVATLVTMLVAGCVGPSRTDGDYRAKAANTAEAASSTMAIARLTAELVAADRVLSPYASLTLSRAESDADSITTAFSVVQPPSRKADRIRARVLDALSQARAILSDLRIAARRGDTARVRELAGHARRSSDDLRRLEAELGP